MIPPSRMYQTIKKKNIKALKLEHHSIGSRIEIERKNPVNRENHRLDAYEDEQNHGRSQ